MHSKLVLAFILVCFSCNLFAQLTLDQKVAFIIEATQHSGSNLWWGHEIPAGYLEAMKQYIVLGADPNVRSNHGNTPLHYAAAAGDLEFIESLVCEHHVDVDSPNANGVTPLMTAAMFGQKKAMELLIALNAKIDERDHRRGRTALHWSVKAKKQASISLLWSLGADINAMDIYGRSPLNYVSWSKYGGNEVWYLLISYGARMTQSVSWLADGAQLLPITDNSVIIRGVKGERMTRRPDPFFALRISSSNLNSRFFLRDFLTYPENRAREINQFRNRFGHSLLFSAVYFRNIPCVLLLLERGANPLNPEHGLSCSSLVLANRIPDFHQLNVLTGETYFHGIFRAAMWHFYLLLAPITRDGAPMFLAADIVRYIAFLTVSVHIPKAERRL